MSRLQQVSVDIIQPSVQARGTRKIVEEYRDYLEGEGAAVNILKPPAWSNSWAAIVWELLGLYLVQAKKISILVSVNGRISPVAMLLRRSYLVAVLDTMNFGSKRAIGAGYSITERLNITINSCLFPLTVRKARWVTTISQKSAQDILSDLKGALTGRKPIVVYPSGSFSGRDLEMPGEIRQRQDLGDGEKRSAIWISGETRNKGFWQGLDLASMLASHHSLQELNIYGIRNVDWITRAEEKSYVETDMVTFKSTQTPKEELVESYLDSKVSFCLSIEEGYGLPFLDAIMFGIPVVATNIKTYREIVDLAESICLLKPEVYWVERKRIKNVNRKRSDEKLVDWMITEDLYLFVEQALSHRSRSRIDMCRRYNTANNLLKKYSSEILIRLLQPEMK